MWDWYLKFPYHIYLELKWSVCSRKLTRNSQSGDSHTFMAPKFFSSAREHHAKIQFQTCLPRKATRIGHCLLLDYQTQSTTHCLSLLLRLIFSYQKGKYMHYNPLSAEPMCSMCLFGFTFGCIVIDRLLPINVIFFMAIMPRLSPPSPCQIRPGRFPFLRLPFRIHRCLSPIYIRSARVMKPRGHRRRVCNNAARFSNPETTINGFVVV